MKYAVTAPQLAAAAPSGRADIIAAIATASPAVFAKYGIVTRARALGFLSTALEESGFRVLTEDLNYSAARLTQVWPKRFPYISAAAPFAGNPRALANAVYGGRMGNVGADDGWKYRGQGLIQITGRNNFARLEKLTGLPLLAHPELATDPAHMLECSVALFCEYPGILAHCDREEWRAVWALVGSGRADGPVINLGNHETALTRLKIALPASQDGHAPAPSPAGGKVAPAAPIPPPDVPKPVQPAPTRSLLGWFIGLFRKAA